MANAYQLLPWTSWIHDALITTAQWPWLQHVTLTASESENNKKYTDDVINYGC